MNHIKRLRGMLEWASMGEREALTAAIADMERMEKMEKMKGIGCYRVFVNGYGAWIENDRNPLQPPQTFREAIDAA
jgi:hypothetical protein